MNHPFLITAEGKMISRKTYRAQMLKILTEEIKSIVNKGLASLKYWPSKEKV